MLRWTQEEAFEVGGTSFRTMPVDYLDGAALELDEDEFFLCKPVAEIDSYVELVRSRSPRRIVELGVFGGGSTMFLAQVASPERIVAVDLAPLEQVDEKIGRQIAAGALDDGVIHLHGGIDQADRSELARIYTEGFGDAEVDLVIDDCSHFYAPTLASFNELFPRLRTGGLYVIEDWRWAHHDLDALPIDGSEPERMPVTRLLLEALTSIAATPGVIESIAVEPDKALIVRGEAPIDPATFDVTALSEPGGRTYLRSGKAERKGLFRR